MQVGVLGPLTARIGAFNLVPRAQQPRQVLTLLAIAAGQMVGIAELIRELWGDGPPDCALTVIQTYMVLLRKSLAHGFGRSTREISNEVLVTHRDGYTLRLNPEALDAYQFDSLARHGSRLLASGRADEASRQLSRALDLWRGPVLADLRPGPVLELDVTRLTMARLVTTEQRIEADLELGRHYEVLAQLADLTARHPLDETLQQQYMLALYRTGRRTKALEVYHRLRNVLAAELGLEPCRSAQRIHQAILRADPDLDNTHNRVA